MKRKAKQEFTKNYVACAKKRLKADKEIIMDLAEHGDSPVRGMCRLILAAAEG